MQISAGLAELDVPSMASLVVAVAGNASKQPQQQAGTLDSAAAFVGAVLSASQDKLRTASFGANTKLAGALAASGAVPTAGWLRALQLATAGGVGSAAEGEVAELAWAVATLASAVAYSATAGSAAGHEEQPGALLAAEWRQAFEQVGAGC